MKDRFDNLDMSDIKKGACMIHFIYRWKDPLNPDAVLCTKYVGMTNDPNMRFDQHMRCKGNNTEKNRWVQELDNLSLSPIVEIIEIIYTGKTDALEREKYWISHYHNQGCQLFNIHLIPKQPKLKPPKVPKVLKKTRMPKVPRAAKTAKATHRKNKANVHEWIFSDAEINAKTDNPMIEEFREANPHILLYLGIEKTLELAELAEGKLSRFWRLCTREYSKDLDRDKAIAVIEIYSSQLFGT